MILSIFIRKLFMLYIYLIYLESFKIEMESQV
jgi:hypothetical protein